MKLKRPLLPWFRHSPRRLQESLFPPTLCDTGWRSIASFGVPETIDISAQQRVAERLWLSHPLVGRAITLLADFTIGEGLTVIARDPSVQGALDALIAAHRESWESLQRAAATHLAVYGEAFLVLSTDGPSRGLPRFELIQPTLVASYDHAGLAIGYGRDRILIPRERVVHVTAQAGTPGNRGIPELARIVPWITQYDQWLTDRVKLNKSRGSFAFLRRVPGWGIDPASSLAASSAQQPVPAPGSVLVVNDQEDWKVLAPPIGADDASADGRALKLMVLAGLGIAEHYVGDLAESNLATAKAAELPMLKRFEAHQRRVLALFHAALSRALAMVGLEGPFHCTLPAPGLTDAHALTATLVLQLEHGLISRATAQSLIPWITDTLEEDRRIADERASSPIEEA